MKHVQTVVNMTMRSQPAPALDRLTLTDTAETHPRGEDEQWTEVRRRKQGRCSCANPPSPLPAQSCACPPSAAAALRRRCRNRTSCVMMAAQCRNSAGLGPLAAAGSGRHAATDARPLAALRGRQGVSDNAPRPAARLPAPSSNSRDAAPGDQPATVRMASPARTLMKARVSQGRILLGDAACVAQATGPRSS